MKIRCDDCLKEYDDSHMEGYDDFDIQAAAKCDGWKISFMNSCPECWEKYKEEIDNE